MAVTCIIPALPSRAEEESVAAPAQTKSDIQLKSASPLGELLFSGDEEPTEAAKFDGSCAVSDVFINGRTAKVTYVTAYPGDLVLGFYSDDETQMYGSCTVPVTSKATDAAISDEGIASASGDLRQTVTLNIPADIPEYFVVKAYLVGASFLPLCEAYTSNMYTEGVTKARNAVSSDFDQELVVQLDDDPDTNFMVLSESTRQITYDGVNNLLQSADMDSGVYTFTNTDAQLTALTAGDVVFYNYNSGEQMLVFTVDSITENDGTVMIQTRGMESSDAFDVIKIEQTVALESKEEMSPGQDLGNGLTYIGRTEVEESSRAASQSLFPMAQASGKVTSTLFEEEFKLEWKKEAPQISKGSFSIQGDVFADASIKVKAYLEINLYEWLNVMGEKSEKQISLVEDVTLSGSIGGEGKAKLYLKGFSGSVCNNMVTYDIGVGLELSGKIWLEGSAKTSMKQALHINDSDIWLNNDFLEPCTTTDLTVNGNAFLGPYVGGAVKIDAHIPGSSVEFELSAKFGLQVTVTKKLIGEEPDGISRHLCKNCLTGKLELIGKCGAKYKFFEKDLGKFGKIGLSGEKNAADSKFTIFDFYYSDDLQEWGIDECPNRAYAVLFGAEDEKDNPLSDADITVTNDDTGYSFPLKTDKDSGEVKYYLESGCYTVKMTWGEYSKSRKFTHVDSYQVIEVNLDTGGAYQAYLEEEKHKLKEEQISGKNVSQVSLGFAHGAAVTDDGDLYTWGYNSYGQLGDGTTEQRTEPIKIMDHVACVSLGTFHSAAVTENGTLYTWGRNEGRLGDGTTADSATPVKIMEHVVSVSLGDYYSAAVTEDGSLYIWGMGDNGAHTKPVKVLDQVKSVDIFVSGAAIMQDGSLYVWEYPYDTPKKFMDNVRAVSMRRNCGAAITTDGCLYTFGNDFGSGLGWEVDEIYWSDGLFSEPVKIMDDVAEVSLGEYHSAAVTTDGSLYTWNGIHREDVDGNEVKLDETDVDNGYIPPFERGNFNPYGALGNGTTNGSFVPVKVADHVKAASAGHYSTAIINEDDKLYVCGMMFSDSKQRVTEFSSSYSSCAVTEDGSLYICRGTFPVKIMEDVKTACVGDIYYYYNYSTAFSPHGLRAAVTTDGSLYMWSAREQQEGEQAGAREYSRFPEKILENVIDICVNQQNHFAAITADGSLYLWGENQFGQLGTGTTEDCTEPVKVMANVTAVSLGAYHSAAITSDGSLYTWGRNNYGQLGDGTTEDRYVPTKIMEHVTAVSLGDDASAAVTENGNLYSWGEPDAFSYFPSDAFFSPTVIMENVASVSRGQRCIAVVKTNGDLYTWGYSRYGQLGDGTVDDYKEEPKKIMEGIAEVCMGCCVSSAISKDGRLYVWGDVDRENHAIFEEMAAVPIECFPSVSTPVKVTIPANTEPVLNNAPATMVRSYAGEPDTATFGDLEPGRIYNFYAMVSKDAENPFDSGNLLYINQYTADESGTITVSYTPVQDDANAERFVMLLPEVQVAEVGYETEPDADTGNLGDVNADGSVNATDAAEVLTAAAILGAGGEPDLTEAQQTAADVNGDGDLNATDAAIILQFAAAVGAGEADAKIEDFCT